MCHSCSEEGHRLAGGSSRLHRKEAARLVRLARLGSQAGHDDLAGGDCEWGSRVRAAPTLAGIQVGVEGQGEGRG